MWKCVHPLTLIQHQLIPPPPFLKKKKICARPWKIESRITACFSGNGTTPLLRFGSKTDLPSIATRTSFVFVRPDLFMRFCFPYWLLFSLKNWFETWPLIKQPMSYCVTSHNSIQCVKCVASPFFYTDQWRERPQQTLFDIPPTCITLVWCTHWSHRLTRIIRQMWETCHCIIEKVISLMDLLYLTSIIADKGYQLFIARFKYL